MKCCSWIVVGVALAATGSAAHAQLPDSKILTLDVARSIAEEAMAQCHSHGYRISVLVVDALNEPKFMLRDDGAPAVTAEVVKMTAAMAMIYNNPSAPGPGASPDGVSQSFVDGTMKARGAVPIKVGQATIDDVACATAALAKLADRLK